MTALPDSMRLSVEAYGETPMDALDNHIKLVPQTAPDPANLAPTDVIVKVRSAAVGWVDLLMASGQYQHMCQPPYTPGLEYSGDVVWRGAEATVSVGDRVIADGLLTGPRSHGAHQKYGGFAGYAVAPSHALRPLPDAWSYDQGACLLGNYETAYHCLFARGAIAAGETVLILGASGSTGLAAVHLAKIADATVIATGRNAEKLEGVANQGADHVIHAAEPKFRDAVKELTGGRGVDLVYDGVGGPSSLEAIRCVRFGARYLVVGWAATPFVAKGKGQRGAPNANVLPTNLIMMKGLDVLGCPTAISTHQDPTIRRRRLAAIQGWIDSGQLRPHVGESFALTEYVEAMKAKWTSRFVGGCVVHPW